MRWMMASNGFLAAGVIATALFGAPLGCGGGSAQPTNASPSCYPSCIATLLQQCPLQGACQGTVGSESATVCYANGIKVNDQLMSGPEMVTVTNASGQLCYTVTETSAAGATARLYTVSTANGQTAATITDNQKTEGSATINCDGLPTTLKFNGLTAACQPLWWDDEQRCTSGTCSIP